MDETQMQPVAPGGIGEMGSPEQAAMYQAAQKADPRQIAKDSMDVARELDPRTTDQFVEQLRALNLPAEVIDALIMMVDALLKDPANYAKNRQELLDSGVPPDLLPEQFDPNFLGAMKIGLQSLDQTPDVQAFAKGGIVTLKPIAREMAKMGRGGDKHLVHVNDTELKALKSMGGVGTINPYTGLQEFGFFKSIGKAISNVGKSISNAVSSVGKAVKSFASSTVGKIVLTVAIGALAGPALAGYLGVTSAAGVAGVSAALGSGGATLLGGGSLKDAIKSAALSGATAYGATGLFQGFDAQYQGAGAGAGAKPTADLSGVPTEAPTDINLSNIPQGTEVGAVPAPAAPDVSQLATQNVVTPGAVSASQAPVLQSGMSPFADQGLYTSPDLLDMSQVPMGTPAAGPVLTSGAGPASEFGMYSSPDMIDMSQIPQGTPTPIAAGPVIQPAVAPGGIGTYTASPGPMGYLEQGYQNIKDFYMGTPPTIDARNAAAMQQFGQPYSALANVDKAVINQSLAPTFGTGTKLAATGLGAAYLGGAFNPEPTPEPTLTKGPTGEELLAQDPSKYMPSIYAGQTPVSYATVNPAYYQQRSYGAYNPFAYRPMFRGLSFAAKGGYQSKGIESLSKFPRKTGQISGPGTETSDSIPAKLSDGEFVMTARAVRGMGNGSRRLGAKRMYQLMAALEKRSKGKA